jgi:hypothetical protein
MHRQSGTRSRPSLACNYRTDLLLHCALCSSLPTFLHDTSDLPAAFPPNALCVRPTRAAAAAPSSRLPSSDVIPCAVCCWSEISVHLIWSLRSVDSQANKLVEFLKVRLDSVHCSVHHWKWTRSRIQTSLLPRPRSSVSRVELSVIYNHCRGVNQMHHALRQSSALSTHIPHA